MTSRKRTSRRMRMNASKAKISSDNKWHNFKYRDEVPAKVLKNQFDHLREDDVLDGFLKYRNHWYHTSDFMRLPDTGDATFKGWDGAAGDSYFSGVVIKLSSDGEQYKIGTYIS